MNEMEDDEIRPEQIYRPNDIVWVKISSMWWPAEVCDKEKLDPDVTEGLKKPPLAVVKFLQEDVYEFIRDFDLINHYHCKKKTEFLKLGFEKYLKYKNEAKVALFPLSVQEAERRTGGDPEIIHDPEFGLESAEGPNNKTIDKRRPSLVSDATNRSRPEGEISVQQPSAPVKRAPTWDPYPKFISHEFNHRAPPADDSSRPPVVIHQCSKCSYQSTDLGIIMWHHKQDQHRYAHTGRWHSGNPKKKEVVKRKKDDTPEPSKPTEKKLLAAPVGESTPAKKVKKEAPATLEISHVGEEVSQEWDDCEEEDGSVAGEDLDLSIVATDTQPLPVTGDPVPTAAIQADGPGQTWDPYPKFISHEFNQRAPPADDSSRPPVVIHQCSKCSYQSTDLGIIMWHHKQDQHRYAHTGRWHSGNPKKKEVVKRKKDDTPEPSKPTEKKLLAAPVGESTPAKKVKKEAPATLEISHVGEEVSQEWDDCEEEDGSVAGEDLDLSIVATDTQPLPVTGDPVPTAAIQADEKDEMSKATEPATNKSSCFDFDEEEPSEPTLQSLKFGHKLPRAINPDESTKESVADSGTDDLLPSKAKKSSQSEQLAEEEELSDSKSEARPRKARSDVKQVPQDDSGTLPSDKLTAMPDFDVARPSPPPRIELLVASTCHKTNTEVIPSNESPELPASDLSTSKGERSSKSSKSPQKPEIFIGSEAKPQRGKSDDTKTPDASIVLLSPKTELPLATLDGSTPKKDKSSKSRNSPQKEDVAMERGQPLSVSSEVKPRRGISDDTKMPAKSHTKDPSQSSAHQVDASVSFLSPKAELPPASLDGTTPKKEKSKSRKSFQKEDVALGREQPLSISSEAEPRGGRSDFTKMPDKTHSKGSNHSFGSRLDVSVPSTASNSGLKSLSDVKNDVLSLEDVLKSPPVSRSWRPKLDNALKPAEVPAQEELVESIPLPPEPPKPVAGGKVVPSLSEAALLASLLNEDVPVAVVSTPVGEEIIETPMPLASPMLTDSQLLPSRVEKAPIALKITPITVPPDTLPSGAADVKVLFSQYVGNCQRSQYGFVGDISNMDLDISNMPVVFGDDGDGLLFSETAAEESIEDSIIKDISEPEETKAPEPSSASASTSSSTTYKVPPNPWTGKLVIKEVAEPIEMVSRKLSCIEFDIYPVGHPDFEYCMSLPAISPYPAGKSQKSETLLVSAETVQKTSKVNPQQQRTPKVNLQQQTPKVNSVTVQQPCQVVTPSGKTASPVKQPINKAHLTGTSTNKLTARPLLVKITNPNVRMTMNRKVVQMGAIAKQTKYKIQVSKSGKFIFDATTTKPEVSGNKPALIARKSIPSMPTITKVSSRSPARLGPSPASKAAIQEQPVQTVQLVPNNQIKIVRTIKNTGATSSGMSVLIDKKASPVVTSGSDILSQALLDTNLEPSNTMPTADIFVSSSQQVQQVIYTPSTLPTYTVSAEPSSTVSSSSESVNR